MEPERSSGGQCSDARSARLVQRDCNNCWTSQRTTWPRTSSRAGRSHDSSRRRGMWGTGTNQRGAMDGP
eukprot:1758866-Rhodomonas_salina.1